MTPFDQRRFNKSVRQALEAARTAPGRSVDTRDVLLALMRVDIRGEWDRIALEFGGEDAVAMAPVADPQESSPMTWNGFALSGTCARALDLAVRLADAYETDDVSAGLMAVALVADPAAAAAAALTHGDMNRHAALLDLLQDAVVGHSLGGLDEALYSWRSGPARGPGAPDGPDVAGAGDAVGVLAVALDAVEDTKLRDAYERLKLDGETIREIEPLLAGLRTVSAGEIVKRAKLRYDVNLPEAPQLIATAMTEPGERLARALWLLGIPARAIAFEAETSDARTQRVGEEITDTVNAFTHLNAILSAAVSFSIVRHVVVEHDWWPGIPVALMLIWVTWSGLLVGDLMLSAVLWFWLGPWYAALAAAMALADHLLSWSERRNAFNRTGMRLTRKEWRRHIRLRTARQAGPVTAVVLWRRRRRLTPAMEGGNA